jgi:hypothetical protein
MRKVIRSETRCSGRKGLADAVFAPVLLYLDGRCTGIAQH